MPVRKDLLWRRITPTYMGNTRKGIEQDIKRRDHPHIHGEHCSYSSHALLSQGSPPHTWGTPNFWLTYFVVFRITPTYMGNTSVSFKFLIPLEDHPHIHGEHNLDNSDKWTVSGSPPHTWGTRIDPSSCNGDDRITPTYMGNTKVWIPWHISV